LRGIIFFSEKYAKKIQTGFPKAIIMKENNNEKFSRPRVVVHACNHSYLGFRYIHRDISVAIDVDR
jgi:hypothetical protein